MQGKRVKERRGKREGKETERRGKREGKETERRGEREQKEGTTEEGDELCQDTEIMECAFCHSPSQNQITGKLFIKKGVAAHQNCMLFSPKLVTRGSENLEDFAGFLVQDVKKEVQRSRRLKCNYCKKNNASIGCDVKQCPRTFHYPCAAKHGLQIVEEEEYKIYCKDHEAQENGNTGEFCHALPHSTSIETSDDTSLHSIEPSHDAVSPSTEITQDVKPFSNDPHNNAVFPMILSVSSLAQSPASLFVETGKPGQEGASPSQVDCPNEASMLFHWLQGTVYKEMQQMNQHLASISTSLLTLVQVLAQTPAAAADKPSESPTGWHCSELRVPPPTIPLASGSQGATCSPSLNQKGQKRRGSDLSSDLAAKK
ncbi:uncharacterized protein LOC102357138 [Latimeria chalumnae]|uniref:uncharacterized protein LOC102357138 n=1 Tax=Latimeria chalumnae TaxID=7897 RepID=UPI0006D906A6|nr:PREDICTED: uncharacterized protein LOC102357138 [Latimeria chalumnae]|eukprot:XP_006009747.2 PREDICTED: uncharacterized protein LOC102357138 [Latimeria chalumnae]